MQPIWRILFDINSFLEDTCVLLVVAYLLTRGRVLSTLLAHGPLRKGDVWLAGVVLGGLGATEYLFPNQRYPYVPQTLFVTFASLTAGPTVGLLAGAVITVAAILFRADAPNVGAMIVGLAASVGMATALRRRFRSHTGVPNAGVGLLAGIVSQTFALLLAMLAASRYQLSFSLPLALLSVPANGVGVMLLLFVVHDAVVRTEAESNRMAAERARVAAANHHLTALRARVHPHFLYNTLTSIAALCSIDPNAAEEAAVNLGALMRRALEADLQSPVPIANEFEDIETYLAIEGNRLGSRLHVEWDVAGIDTQGVNVPPFSLVTLVENAVQHGIAQTPGPGVVRIVVRRSPSGPYIRIFVSDTGAGMSSTIRHRALHPDPNDREHGLSLLNQQLHLLYGRHARIRIFSREDSGTTVAFQAPAFLVRTRSAGTFGHVLTADKDSNHELRNAVLRNS